MIEGETDRVATLVRVVIPLALVFAGVLTLAAGAARVLVEALGALGVGPPTSVFVAISGAGVVPLAIVGGLLMSHSPGPDTRRFAGGGLAVMGLGVVAYPLTPTGIGALTVACAYLAGLLVALVGVGKAAVSSDPVTRAASSARTAVLGSIDRDEVFYPTDGGNSTEDLNFPLDDE